MAWTERRARRNEHQTYLIGVGVGIYISVHKVHMQIFQQPFLFDSSASEDDHVTFWMIRVVSLEHSGD